MPESPANRLRRAAHSSSAGYPWDAVLLAMLLVGVIVVLGSFAVDAAGATRWIDRERPAAALFRSTCYWLGDTHNLIRIAGNGYTDYWNWPYDTRHLSLLPDRSWWPVYVNLTALVLRVTGGDACSGWWVNLVAMILMPLVVQGVTGTRRPLLLIGVALLPFGVWLFTGNSEGTFLLLSGLLLWLSLRRPSERWWANTLTGLGGLLLGVLIGLTKPNALALLPGFAVLGLSRTLAYARNHIAGDPPAPLRGGRAGDGGRLLRRLALLLDDANPGWPALLGTVGMVLGLGLWFAQTSGFYPLYVLMVQRTMWHREFEMGNILAFLNYITEGWRWLPYRLHVVACRSMLYFATVTVAGIVLARDLPPRWPGATRARPIPLYAWVGLASALLLMLSSGQAHSFDRYLMGNIFFVVPFLRYVYGDEDEPSLAELPALVRAHGPGSLRAALRLAVLGCSLGLIVYQTAVLSVYGE